jgi:hypothetical protein
MSAFVVRQQGFGDSPQAFVGIYIADGEDGLAPQVASTHDLNRCEYASLPTECMYAPELRVPGATRLYREERTARPAGESDDEWRAWFLGGRNAQWRRFGQDQDVEEFLILSVANG